MKYLKTILFCSNTMMKLYNQGYQKNDVLCLSLFFTQNYLTDSAFYKNMEDMNWIALF